MIYSPKSAQRLNNLKAESHFRNLTKIRHINQPLLSGRRGYSPQQNNSGSQANIYIHASPSTSPN